MLMHVWVCDADGTHCGEDPTEGTDQFPLYCFGEAQTTDGGEGSPSRYDGQSVYQSQIWTPGEEATDWPIDQSGNRIDAIQQVRVVCMYQG